MSDKWIITTFAHFLNVRKVRNIMEQATGSVVWHCRVILCNFLFSEAISFISVGFIDELSWFLFLIHFLPQTDLGRQVAAADAVLFAAGIQWTCLNVNTSLNSSSRVVWTSLKT